MPDHAGSLLLCGGCNQQLPEYFFETASGRSIVCVWCRVRTKNPSSWARTDLNDRLIANTARLALKR